LKVVASSCVLFEGAKDTSGYGLVRVGRKLWKAHRFAWTKMHGGIPDGLQVLHRCDVRACINVEHLFLGTLADNMADRNAKGRQARLQGERHNLRKLSDAQVLEIRAAHLAGESTARLAAKFGVHKSTAHRAATRRNWRHLP